MTTHPVQFSVFQVNKPSIFKSAYLLLVSPLVFVIQAKLRGDIRLKILGARPFLIVSDFLSVIDQGWVRRLSGLMASIPMLEPLGVVNPEEFEILKDAYRSKAPTDGGLETLLLHAETRARGRAALAGIGGDANLPAPYCQIAFNEMHVTCEGDAYMCCWQPRPQSSIGNVLNASIDEIWNSKLATDTRAAILRGEFPKPCQEAAGCPYAFHDHRPGKAAVKRTRSMMIDINLPNTHCNIGGHRPTEAKPACIMCQRSHKDYLWQDDSGFDEVLEKIRMAMPKVERLHIQGIAEPFWHDEIFRVMDKIGFDEHRNYVGMSTTTNGTVFTPERQKRLLERCPALQVNFSIDAATPESYRKIRRLDAFETVLNNVRSFGKLRKTYPNVIFRIQNNVNMLNIDDVVGMVEFAAEVGVDAIELNPTEGDFDFVVNSTTAHLFAEAERDAREAARRLGVSLEIQRPLDMGFEHRAPVAPRLLSV